MNPKKIEELERRLLEAEQKLREYEKIMHDGSQERQRENELQASKELFEKIFETHRSAILILDAAIPPKIQNANRAFEHIFGYTRQEAFGRTTTFLHVNERGLAEFQKNLYPMIQDQGFLFLPDFKMKRKDGLVFPVELMVSPLQNDQGKQIGWVSVIRDITQRKLINDALRESEHRYRTLFEKNINPIAVIDRTGQYIHANSAFLQFVELTTEQLLNMRVFDFAPPGEKYDQEVEHTQVWDSGGTIETEYFINGRVKVLELTVSPIQYQGVDAIVGIGKDITQRKQAEDALKKHTHRLNTILNSLTDMVLETDTDMKILWANQAALSYNPQAVGMKCHEAFGSRNRNEPCEGCPCYQAILSGGIEKNVMFQPVSSGISGESYWMNIGIPIKDDDGRIVSLIEVSRNVTHEKQAEAALRESQEKLQNAYRLAHIGVWNWQVATDTVFWTEELYRIAGLDPRLPAPTYAQHSKIYTSESWERLKSAIKRTIETGERYELELQMFRPDGSTRWVNVFGGVINDEQGQVKELYGTVQDITERREAEDALRESQERLKEAQRLAKIGNWDWDTRKQSLIWSDEVYQIFGIEPGSLHPSVEAFEAMIHPDDRGSFLANRAKMLEEKQYAEIDHRIVLPSGEIRYVQERAKLMLDDEGNVYQVIGTVQDITESKEAEKMIRESLDQIQKDAEIKSSLLQEVNHRVANNLLAITGLLALERCHLKGDDHAAYREIMEALSSRVNSMGKVHAMLSQSEWQPLNLVEMAEYLIRSSLQILPPEKRITLDIEPSSVQVTAKQAHHLALIINELTSNTQKYALLDRNTGCIQVRVTEEKHAIQIEFRDDGPGYPEDVLRMEWYNVGIDLIRQLTCRDLHGNISLQNDSGAVMVIRLPRHTTSTISLNR